MPGAARHRAQRTAWQESERTSSRGKYQRIRSRPAARAQQEHCQVLGAETTTRDSQQGRKGAFHNHQEPDERTTHFSGEPPRTGRKPPKNHPQPDEEPDEKPLSTGRKPDENHPKPDEEPPTTTQRTTQAEQLDALRAQLDTLRGDLYAERERAAVAAAERDAERRRADAAELREQQQAQTVKDLTAALQTAQQQAADLTAALTAAQALHAGTLRGQLETHEAEPAAVPTPTAAATAEPAPDQTGTQSGDGADDQSKPKRRGLFARLFGKS